MRKLCLGFSFAAMAVLAACNGGSGTNADSESLEKSSNSSSKQEKEYDGEVEYIDDLPKCTERKDGDVYYVEDEDITYTCTYDDDLEKGEWVKKTKKDRDDDDQESSSSVEDEESSSSAKKANISSSSSESDDEYDSEEDDDDDEIPDVERCDVSRTGDKVFVSLVVDGISEYITMTIDAEGIITEIGEFDSKISKADFDEACKDARDDNDNLTVDCDASALTITTTYKDEDIENTDELEAMNEFMCQVLLDPESVVKDLEDAADKMAAAED